MTDFYWMGGTDSLASKYQNWSASSGGSALASWPGGSPGASDNFFFNSASAVNCTWESSVVSMTTIQSIQQSLTAPYTGILNMTITPTMQGLILNAELQGSGVITLTGANLTALNDSASRKRYVLNGQFAKVSAYTGSYKIAPAQAATYLDNGPYPAMTLDTNNLTLAYNVPTSTVHDHADDATIHIKGAFVANSTSGFSRIGAPDMSEDTKVKIKFDNPAITYSARILDFNMATASFRGTEIPVTGSQTYGSVAQGITVTHYGVVVFAGTPGEVCTIRNQTTLECYSLEVKAGSVLRAQTQGTGKPAKVNVQTQPIIKGVWAFHANDGHSYLSPKMSFVANVASGGTGLDRVQPNALLIGSAAGAMQNLAEIAPGTNGYVLTMTGGAPAWAASGGGGGGMTSFTVAGTSGSNQTITDGNTLTIAAGAGITTTGSATDTVTIASTITQYTDANAIAAVEGEATLDLTGDVSMAANKYLCLNESTYSASPIGSDDTKVLLSSDSTGTNDAMLRIDTDAGFLRMGAQNASFCHFYTDRGKFYFNRPIHLDGGSLVSYDEDLQFVTDGTGSNTYTRIYIDAAVEPCRVGIGNGFTPSLLPQNTLHVKTIEETGDAAYVARFQAAEGNVGTTRYGGIHLDNDNNAPIDGADWSAQRWQIGQRDGDQLDISFGTPTNTNVAASDTKLRIKTDGKVGILKGSTDPAQALDVTGTIRASTLVDLPILGGDANGDIGAGGLTVRDEGSPLGNAASVTSFDFVGAGVVASRSSATDPVVTVTVAGGGGGGVTAAMLTSTNIATCPGSGGTITTTGDARQIAYVNGDTNAPITVTNPTADGVRLTIISIAASGTGQNTLIATLSPILSLVNGLQGQGLLHTFSNVELIWKVNSMNAPDGDPNAPLISGWHLASTQNYRAFDQPGFEV